MFAPVYYEIRVRKNVPIVEVRGEGIEDVSKWINDILQFIEEGEKRGGRLIPEEPNDLTRPNMVHYALIFKNNKKAMEFAESIANR